MVMSMYLSYVLPSEYGVRKSVFFPIIGKKLYIVHVNNLRHYIGLYKLLYSRRRYCQPIIKTSLSVVSGLARLMSHVTSLRIRMVMMMMMMMMMMMKKI